MVVVALSPEEADSVMSGASQWVLPQSGAHEGHHVAIYLKDCTCRGSFWLCSRSRHTSLETCLINLSAFKSCFCSSFVCSAWQRKYRLKPQG